MKKLIFVALLAILFAACKKQDEPPKATSESKPVVKASEPAPLRTVFHDPIKAVRTELPSEALPYWRDAAGGSKPALLIFSIHPFLFPLEDEQREDVADLISSGTEQDFVDRGSFYRADPAFVPPQTVSAALESDMFSRLIWIFPSGTTPDQLILETFRGQMQEAGFLTPEESASLALENGTFSGTIRGIPFRAIHPAALHGIDEAVILHLDLSYFKGLYKSEIKTPLYPMLQQTVKAIQPLNIQARGVTLSYSTLEGEMSLETRFLVNRFAELLATPDMIDKGLPTHWDLHSEALYTINFFLESKVTELYERATQEAPEDPAALYGLALRHLRENNLTSGLELIERAASQDPGYALEFLRLADRAFEGKDYKNAAMLLRKGQPYFPFNPFIDIQLAGIYLQANRIPEARDLLHKLKQLPWSTAVHQQIPQVLDDMLAESEKPREEKKAHP